VLQTIDLFLRLFNIRRDELRPALLFFVHNFFLGLGLALMYTAVSTFFLSRLSAAQLPIVYMLSALVLLISGRIYSWFEHRYPIQQFLPATLLFIIFITLLFRLQWSLFSGMLFPLVLMILYRFVYLISNLEFWGLSALVFDVRQSKRLFSFISSGDVPAKLLGYLSVSVIVPIIGLQNLLLISVASFIISYLFLKRTVKVIPVTVHHSHRSSNTHHKKNILSTFFENKLITILAWIAFFTAIAYNLVDYNFLSVVQEKYHTEEALASFLGLFFAVGYAVTIIVKVLLTGRFADRMGVTKALLILPLVLLIFSIVFMFKGSLQFNQFSNLVFIGLMYMAMNVAKTAINDPLLLVLFQPLPSSLRLHGHTVLKGIFEPVALGILGVALFFSIKMYGTANFYFFNFALFFVILTWISIVFLAKNKYLEALKNAINKRFISGSDIGIADKNYLEIIRQNLSNDRVPEILYAISVLERANLSELKNNMQRLLKNKDLSILNRVFEIIIKNKWNDFAEQVFDLMKNGQPEIKVSAIKTYCQLDAHAYERIIPFLSENDQQIEVASIAGLITSDYPAAQVFATHKLNILINSNDTMDQLSAVDVIQETKDPSLYEYLVKLIGSKETQVKATAIRAAGIIQNEKVIPVLIGLLAIKSFRLPAYDSLCLFGEKTVGYLRNSILIKDDLHLRLLAIKICSRLESKEAIEYLIEFAHSKNVQIRDKAISALNSMHYQSGKNENLFFNELLEYEFSFAALILNALVQREFSEKMISALKYERDKSIERIFLLLRVLYENETVNRASFALLQQNKEKRANAFEALDTIIPKRIHDKLILITGENLAESKIDHSKTKQLRSKANDFLYSILDNNENRFTDWTIACALELTELNDLTARFFLKYLSENNILLKEVALSSLMFFKLNRAETFYSIDKTNSLKLIALMEDIKQSKLSEMEKVIALKSTRLFADTPENIIAEISAAMQEVEVHEDDIVFSKGDSGNSMYVVFEGEIRIHDGEKTFTVCTKGDFFGELAVLDPEPRSASATALTDGLLLKIGEEDVYELMEDRTEVLRSVMRILCGIIRRQNENLMTV
jgi:ATP/ADP translocase